MQAELFISLYCLQVGKIILYPTDTVWGIGCDATDELTVSKIFNIKKRKKSKSLVVLVNGIDMLKEYVDHIPPAVISVLETAKRPTTIIYNNPEGLAKNLIAADNTVAIRITEDEFCRKLIKRFGKPIVSTSANISNQPTPKSFKEINKSVLEAVDYVVNLQRDKITNAPSTILKISDKGALEVIRE